MLVPSSIGLVPSCDLLKCQRYGSAAGPQVDPVQAGSATLIADTGCGRRHGVGAGERSLLQRRPFQRQLLASD
jgi:hypothetical protein